MAHSSKATIKILNKVLGQLATRPMTFMEVCGTHTVSIFRHGIKALFPKNLNFLSGPGCPVCVTDQGEIDAAISLASASDVILTTYGDMMRVPGSETSLLEEKGKGCDVRIVTSTAEVLDIARENPGKNVVFLAIGFETTSPATATMLLEAERSSLENVSVICFHKRVPPVLGYLAEDPELNIDGFLLPGHVATILGHEPFAFLPEQYGISCCIAGFEAVDIMLAVVELARQVSHGDPRLTSAYPRAVRPCGNVKAQKLLDEVFEIDCAAWRGMGIIENSGLQLKERFSKYDAIRKFSVEIPESKPPAGCRCGDVLSGKITPRECPLFGTACTPVTPVGPCMVSGEGSCSAYFKYTKGGRISWQS